jgi:hypothetical protein
MTIISTVHLERELPPGFTNENDALGDAVAEASAFVNTYARNYDPFDDFSASPLEILAPREVGRICIEVAKNFYFLRIGESSRNGEEIAFREAMLDKKITQLQKLNIEPTWESQAISLDSNNAMVIGSRNTTTGRYPRVLVTTLNNVVSAAGNVWTWSEDWEISKGGRFDDEEPSAWYFYANQDGVEGTLHYLRTYRNDTFDYMKYGTGN